MSTAWRDNGRIVRLCRNAVMLTLAFALAFLEHLLPLELILPLPGVKLGLANIVITVLFFFASPIDAAIVSVLRIGLSALLFGTPISFLFSLFGGVGAYLMLLVCKPFRGRYFSFVGVSVLAATGHHLGQMAAAAVLLDSAVLLTYLPVLLLAGIAVGCATGALLNLCERRLQKLLKRGENN